MQPKLYLMLRYEGDLRHGGMHAQTVSNVEFDMRETYDMVVRTPKLYLMLRYEGDIRHGGMHAQTVSNVEI